MTRSILSLRRLAPVITLALSLLACDADMSPVNTSPAALPMTRQDPPEEPMPSGTGLPEAPGNRTLAFLRPYTSYVGERDVSQEIMAFGGMVHLYTLSHGKPALHLAFPAEMVSMFGPVYDLKLQTIEDEEDGSEMLKLTMTWLYYRSFDDVQSVAEVICIFEGWEPDANWMVHVRPLDGNPELAFFCARQPNLVGNPEASPFYNP